MPGHHEEPTSPPSDGAGGNGERRPSKRRKESHSIDTSSAREVGLMRDGMGPASASFIGSASGIHFIRSVYGAVGSSAASKTSPEHNLVPGEDDRLGPAPGTGSPKSIWRNDEVNDKDKELSGETFSFDDLVDWTSSYFDAWHPAFPFLHAPTILSSYESLAERGTSREASWEVTIAKAIISISLADRRQSNQTLSRPIPQDIVFSSFDAALESVQPAVTRPATILSLQALMCVQLFLVSMLRLNAASRLGGLIVRMAFQLGLHRCPARFPSFSEQDQQLRKRIFWSIYCTERHICHALGLPLTIRDDDVDVCHLDKEQHLLQTINRRPPSQGDGSSGYSQPSPFDERLRLLTFLSKHAKIRGSIMELRNKSIAERDENADTAILINADVTHWWNEVEDFLDQADSQSTPFSHLHKAVLVTLKNECVIALNRPLLALPKQTASYAGAIHSCIGAAKSIISTLHSLLLPVTSGNQAAWYVPMMWPSFTWATWMSAFIILYSAAEGKVNSQVANRNTDRSVEILQKLASRGSVWPHACAVAIEDLKSTMNQRNRGSKKAPDDSAKLTMPVADGFGDKKSPQTRQVHSSSAEIEEERSNAYDEASRSYPSQLSAAASVSITENPSATGGRTTLSGAPGLGKSFSDLHQISNFPQTTPVIPSGSESWPDMDFLPKDVPPFSFGDVDLFQGFDIPFWVGQDNYAAWMGSGP